MLTKAKIKDIQSLQHKKFRDETGLFLAEGPKVVIEILRSSKFDCVEIYALEGWLEQLPASDLLLVSPFHGVVQPFELEKMSALVTPHQVLAVFAKRKEMPVAEVKGEITLVLDDIRDPGNMGTIIRTAHWFGISQIVCSPGTVDIYNGKVVQSTMASLGQVDVYYTNLPEWMGQQAKVPILAAVLNGKPLKDFSGIKEGILIIGNESNGISPAVLSLADTHVTIPRFGDAESLNAAVATALFLYEFKR